MAILPALAIPRRVRLLALAFALVAASAAAAMAVTPAELAALSKAGLGDDVLVALIETSGVPDVLDANAVLALKRDGLSDRVITAAVRASTPPPRAEQAVPDQAAGCGPCEPDPVAYAPQPAAPVVEREVHHQVHYVPWVVHVPARPPARRGPPKPYLQGDRGVGRFINDGVTLPRDTRTDPRR